jgi:acyl-coenzyme A thioesterase PaaI-like protein
MTTPPAEAIVPPPATTTRALFAAPHESGYHDCFGCGRAVPGGLRIRVIDGQPGELTAVVHLTEVHQGEHGLAHGGIVVAVLDEVISLALWRALDRKCLTRRLDTDFRAPMPIGRDVELRASCTGVHGRKAYGRAEALLGGTVLASATGLFIEVSDDHVGDMR